MCVSHGSQVAFAHEIPTIPVTIPSNDRRPLDVINSRILRTCVDLDEDIQIEERSYGTANPCADCGTDSQRW